MRAKAVPRQRRGIAGAAQGQREDFEAFPGAVPDD